MTSRTPYPSYKLSGIDWLGDIPSHWEPVRMRSVTKLRASNVDKLSHDYEIPVRLCNYTDVYKNLKIVNTLPFMRATAKEEEISAFKLEVGDVIFTKDSEVFDDIGIPAVVESTAEDLVCGYHLMMARPSSTVDGRFLAWFFTPQNTRWQFEVSANGVTRFGMPQAGFKDAWFPLPPLDEQRAIADYLDRKDAQINRFIESRHRMIALLEEKKQAIINQAVTRGLDPTVPMKDSGVEWLGEIPAHWVVTGLRRLLREPLQYGANAPSQLFDPDLPRYVRITDITTAGRLSDDTIRSITNEASDGYMLDEGDLLLARSGATVGKSYLHAGYDGPAAFAGYLIRAKVKTDLVDPYFLFGYLNSSAYWQWIRSSTIRATIENVSAEKYAALSVPIAPLGEQRQIVEYLTQVNQIHTQQQSRYELEIDLMLEYRARLISDVVTGKVRVP